MTTAAAPGAPAQESGTSTVSASMAAAGNSDFAAFETAEQAKIKGEPLAAVEVKTGKPAAAAGGGGGSKQPAGAAAAAAAAEQAPAENRQTRADKDQQRINDSIQRGIDAATASLKAEIAELRAKQPAGAAGAAAAAAEPPPAKGTPEWKRFAAMPDAPKIDDFESVADHNAAMAFFMAKTIVNEGKAAERGEAHQAERLTQAQARVDTFLERLDKAKVADPQFSTKLSEEVRALKPFGALAAGEQGGPQNFVAEEVMDSEIPDAMLVALSQPGELDRITAMPDMIARMAGPNDEALAARGDRAADARLTAQRRAHMQHMRRHLLRLEGRLLPSSTAAGSGASAQEHEASPVSAAPPPADTITRARSAADPRASAIARSDFAAFDAIEMDKERARRARA